jgi:hypothetical protein
MQHKITDDAANTFATHFYTGLANSLSLEGSINLARKHLDDNNPIEWGTPVLFSQSEDGHLFDIQQPLGEQERESRIDTLSNAAQVAIQKSKWEMAIKNLQEILKVEKSA